MNLVFKGFLLKSIPALVSVLYAEEYHNFQLKIFCLSAEKFLRGTLQCFRKFLVSKHVKYKRGGGCHDFPSKLFCLTVPKYFVEEPFCVSESFWYRKILWIRGGRGEAESITIFCQKFSVSQCQKIS